MPHSLLHQRLFNENGSGNKIKREALSEQDRLPSQSGQAGKILTTNGDVASWGTLTAANIPSLDASKITSGTFDVDRIPPTALNKVVVVATEADKLTLTSADVQVGDTVKVTATYKMYMVKDDTKLGTEDAFEEYLTSTDWSAITNKPESFTPSAHNHDDRYYISSGTITLGGNSITPLTQHQSLSAYRTSDAQDVIDATKQHVLTAGTGINITDNVISATGGVAEWGNITGTLSNQTDLTTALNAKQGTLTAGTGINITDNVISSTGGAAVWGNITGTLADQTDLQAALNGKQATLPTTTTAGKVLTSTETQGVVQWGDGGGYVLPEATTTTLGGVIIGNGLNISSGVVSVPSMELDNERSFALPDSISVPLKAEIKAEVNAGVVNTIGAVMSTDPTVMSKIIKVTPLSTGTFESLEVNNG